MCQDCGCTIAPHTHNHSHSHEHSHEHHPNPQLNDPKTVEVITKILDVNDTQAAHNREHFEKHGVLAVNLMSSPGSGKTTLLEATIEHGGIKLGVIEGDLETNQDADRIKAKGAPAHQIATGQACHLDAHMVHDGLHHMPVDGLDVCFVENVGNLVCPASYDVGTHFNVVLLSVPEGDDKPAKYPVMFRAADVLLITKCDLLPHFDFSVEKAIKETRKLNPKVDVIEIDSKSGKGIEQWVNYLNMKNLYDREASMCLSIPSKVVEVDENNYATVDTLGVKRQVTLDLIPEEVNVGDYVLIHVGFAMNKISKEEAEESLRIYSEIAEQMQNGEIDDEEGNVNYAT